MRHFCHFRAFFRVNIASWAKEYLLTLFNKYDIVVLCEALHTEDTQWDFIYDVISDKRFVENVGHVFTEYGCAREQAKVDSFMRTTYEDSISLAKAAATLMNYHSGNFYFFMQKLHKFNQSLPDSLKVQEHFTDILSWNYLAGAYYDSISNLVGNGEDALLSYRDSLMASVVIDWYQQTRKKCLVITNTRHAFIVRDSMNPDRFDNEAQYIYEMFPDKTANVMLGGLCVNQMYYSPIQHGLWDRALKNNGNKAVGLDFTGSPFGEDQFDRDPRKRMYQYQYQDVFTGYVFYKPEKEYTHSEQYYKRYAAEQEYEWATQNNLIDSAQGKNYIGMYQDTGGQLGNAAIMSLFITRYHFIDLLIWGIWGFISIIITICNLIFKTKNNYD